MTDHKVQNISVHELNKRRETNPKLCLIDVREENEWQEQHIPGALHIPKDTLPAVIGVEIPQLDCPIYLHCHAGMRSLHAANNLLALGYQNVYSVDGGIAEWAKAGYPIE